MPKAIIPIFEMNHFYHLNSDDQQHIKNIIFEEYRKIIKNRKMHTETSTSLHHFVAQYYQLLSSTRAMVNEQVEQLFRTNRQYASRYDEYSYPPNYGVEQIKKHPNLFSENFIAYDTRLEDGYRGYLRFQIDCSSGITLKQIKKEMNNALVAKSLINSKSMNVININLKRISLAHEQLLGEMLETCQAELIVDVCDDDVLKLKNPWKAVLVMKKERGTGRTILQGDKTIVQNFTKQIRCFF